MPRQLSFPSLIPELPTLPKGVDFLTSFGAGVLCSHIESYWRARGFAGIVCERYEVKNADGMWGVRSNLVNGKPPVRKAVHA
jgi:hypothetical protein